MRVDRLETWAGPGQVESLAIGLRAVRTDMSALRRVQNQHTTMLTSLTADMSGLKSDVATLKSDVAEILKRLPPLPAS